MKLKLFSNKNSDYPRKQTMNLYYKPDCTTKSATIVLYMIFVMVCLLGLGKVPVYDLWEEKEQTRRRKS